MDLGRNCKKTKDEITMVTKTHNIWEDQDGNSGLYPAGNETYDPDFSLEI